ncbi:MAG: hypothetical protein M1816_000886 [Peltula sp. TS41687]|nr:MAG: hypothetical protein M1816_000886 [Peltula sp. TS41687]
MEASRASTILTALRTLLGAFCLTSPSLADKMFRLPVHRTHAPLWRYFGIRDVVLAALLGTSKSAEERRRILLAGVINDSFDALISALAMLQGDLDLASNASLVVGPVIFVALGLAALGKNAGVVRKAI